ncbi:lysine--tRNA ligase [Mycoplasma sp. (ex Biomphalaria glabrata)]|uniref:lysine--tRNA ligase n=1 Tax=Mycoplasma sp. (ex Biomphalaria glabrata) TaxID=1749074 RepID=UPI002FF65C5D
MEELFIRYNELSKEELENKNNYTYQVMGRVMAKRDQGKTIFFNIKEVLKSIQCYARQDALTENEFAGLGLMDIGDIVYVTGTIMKTKLGELTLKIKSWENVTKSLKVLPEKYHGLNDIEEKYRHRYVDLITSDETKQVFIDRTKIIKSIRNFLDDQNILEVDTPMLHAILGGAAAEPFVTHHNQLDRDFYLRVAPELFLKRLIVGGYRGVYEMGKNFRNEGISIKHNPEFTAIEIYIANQDLRDMMKLTEDLIKHAASKIMTSMKINYDGNDIDLNEFSRISMIDSIKKETNINFLAKNYSIDDLLKICKEHNIHVENHQKTFGHVVNLFFEHFVEKTLINPTFIYDYPIEISPFAQKLKEDERFTDRFELFIGGREYANAFTELNDPDDQMERLENQLKEKEKGNKEANEIDIDFIEALEYGMPPTGGLGIGIDRLIMLLTNRRNIRDVILFPTLKTK